MHVLPSNKFKENKRTFVFKKTKEKNNLRINNSSQGVFFPWDHVCKRIIVTNSR